MKLIVLYGPPASGKMSIAKELCKITKAKFFPHNVIFDLINPLFGDPRKNHFMWDLYEEIKIKIIKTAKRKNVNLVLTEIYNKPVSDERLEDFINELNVMKVSAQFVKIYCNEEELLERVENKDRKNTKKLNSRGEYQRILKKANLNSTIPFIRSLIIDNTIKSPKQVASEIKKKLKLK